MVDPQRPAGQEPPTPSAAAVELPQVRIQSGCPKGCPCRSRSHAAVGDGDVSVPADAGLRRLSSKSIRDGEPIFDTRRAGLISLTAALAAPAAELPPAVGESFPTQPADLVKETVTVAHGNVKRLRELVDAHPSLAKAAIDWGFGDWEDALGAASHVGNREIAEYLIAKGARPTLYSATMLGQLDVVKASGSPARIRSACWPTRRTADPPPNPC